MTAKNILELTRLFYRLAEEADALNADCQVQVLFKDGERVNLSIISTEHLDLDATIIAVPLLPNGTESPEAGLQFSLEDVQEVVDYKSGHCIFRADVI